MESPDTNVRQMVDQSRQTSGQQGAPGMTQGQDTGTSAAQGPALGPAALDDIDKLVRARIARRDSAGGWDVELSKWLSMTSAYRQANNGQGVTPVRCDLESARHFLEASPDIGVVQDVRQRMMLKLWSANGGYTARLIDFTGGGQAIPCALFGWFIAALLTAITIAAWYPFAFAEQGTGWAAAALLTATAAVIFSILAYGKRGMGWSIAALLAAIAAVALFPMAISKQGEGAVLVHTWFEYLLPFGVTFGQQDEGAGFMPPNEALPLIISAIGGALVGLLIRIKEFGSLRTWHPMLVALNSFAKPLTTVVLAVFVFAVLKLGTVKVGTLDFEAGNASTLYALWVVGFLCGFSERFAPDLVRRTEDVIAPRVKARRGAPAAGAGPDGGG